MIVQWTLSYPMGAAESPPALDRQRAYLIGAVDGERIACIFQDWGLVDRPDGSLGVRKGWSLWYRGEIPTPIRFDELEGALVKAEHLTLKEREKNNPASAHGSESG